MAKRKQPPGPRPNPGYSAPKRSGPPIRPGVGRSATTSSVSTGGVATEPAPLAYRPVLRWPSLVLAVVGVALYANTFVFGHYVLDDVAVIAQNLFVQKGLAGIPDLLRTEIWHFSNISLGYYRPLSLITFAIEHQFFGSNPAVSHVVNGLLYGLTGAVLSTLLQKWLPGNVVVALLIGLVFLAHPVHTEVVANIKSRDEILSFLFIIATAWLYWRYLETDQTSWLLWAVLTQYLAFLSKESALVSLALYPAMAYFFAGRSVWRSVGGVWPFALVALLFFWQKLLMIGTLSGNVPTDLANYPYAIEKTQGITTFKFFAIYLKLLVYPHPLVYDYSYNVIPSGRAGDPTTLAGIGLFIAGVVLTVVGIRRRTPWGFGLVWFFVTMAPGLGFIYSRGGILAERFLYAPVLGFAIVLIWALRRLLVRNDALHSAPAHVVTSLPATVRPYGALLALTAVILGLYGYKTVTRNRAWESNYILFNNDLPNAWNSSQVQRQVANEWIEKGLRAKTQAEKDRYGRLALNHLQQSTRIYPDFGEAYFSMAYVFQNITPNADSARYYYKQTIRAASGYAPAYNNLGVMYQREGKLQLASYYYNRSIAVNPAYQDGRNNAALLKQATGLDVQYLPDSVLQRN